MAPWIGSWVNLSIALPSAVHSGVEEPIFPGPAAIAIFNPDVAGMLANILFQNLRARRGTAVAV